MSPVVDDLRLSEALSAAYSRQGLDYFLNDLMIPGETPQRFGRVAEDWQRDLIAPMIPAFEGLAGLRTYTGPSSFMHILARGHNKSSLEAWLAVWLLLASRRPIKGYILAKDLDQGKIILQSAADTLHYNPWLSESITIHRKVIHGPAGFVEVLSADAGSMYGLQGNLYICDEITHWEKREPWTAVYTGRRKVSPNIVVCLSNAGLIDSWQWDLLQSVRADPDWVIFERPGFLAGWMDRAAIERDKNLLPPSEADRLFNNRWIDPAEEHDYLRRSEAEACQDLGRRLGLMYRLRPPLGVSNAVAGLDYGPKKDRTALAVVHQDAEGVIRLDRLDVWSRSGGRNVQIADVDAWVDEIWRAWRPKLFVADEYQMEASIQRAERLGIPIERFAFRGGAGNFELAQGLRSLVADGRIAWWPGAGSVGTKDDLTEELIGLRVKRMLYGYRFDHDNQKHDDRAFAVGIAAIRALSFPWSEPVRRRPQPPDGPLVGYGPPGSDRRPGG